MRTMSLIAVFTAACATASAQIAPLPMALCAGWQGERTCEQLHEDAQIRILRCTFPPGVGHEPHYHPPHFGYALSGNTTLRITSETGVVDRPMRADTWFTNDAEVRHSAVNAGDETATYLIVEKKYADTRSPEAIAPGLCEE